MREIGLAPTVAQIQHRGHEQDQIHQRHLGVGLACTVIALMVFRRRDAIS